MSLRLVNNPFSSRFVRPTAHAYLFRNGETMDGTIATLRANRCWGEIIGPHGSGKSTLMAALVRRLKEEGIRVAEISFGCARGQRAFALRNARQLKQAELIAIDGFEQCSWLERIRVKRFCRRRGLGLLATSHRPMGLPLLYRACADAARTCQLVRRLAPDRDDLADSRRISGLLAANQNNVREVLFSLYDEFETNLEK